MNTRTLFPRLFMSVLFFALALILTTDEVMAYKKVNELESQRDKITAHYKLMHAKRSKRDKIPAGVTNLVMKAITTGAFHEGQIIKELESVFGKEKMFEYKSNNRRTVMIPLERDDSQLPHIGTIGSQWHLMLELDSELKISRIKMEATSLKILLMIHGIKAKQYQN